MKGACSTLKEEGRAAIANTTKLSDRGTSSIAGIGRVSNMRETISARVQQGPDGGSGYMRIQYGGASLALFSVLASDLTVGQIVVLGDLIRQPFVHQFSTAK